MFSVRLATKEDIPTIIKIAQETWPNTYGHILPESQLKFMLEQMYDYQNLANTMQQKGTFLIATDENKQPVAFAGYEPYEENTVEKTYKLQKLYALPKIQQKGLGKFMLQQIINDIKQKGAKKLILNVNRFNNALSFYIKMGFNVQSRLDIHVGNNYYMNDFILCKNL